MSLIVYFQGHPGADGECNVCSAMNSQRVCTVLALALAALLAVGVLVLPMFVSNCGGNSAALAQVRDIMSYVHLAERDSFEPSFRWPQGYAEAQAVRARLARSHWIPNARFLVYTGPIIWSDAQPSHITVVCDMPFSNVPRRWLGSAPLTHAAAFADGSTRLISVAEFAQLDLGDYVALDHLWER